jgi:hypothetical protein
VGSHDTTEASSKRLPRADDAYSQSAPVHASDADAPTSRSARRARGRPGKMNGGLCQLPGYLFTASHKGQAPPNHDATANSPLLLWVWGCRCDVPRCAPLARLALYSPCPCPCRAADCGVALGWQHAPAHGDTGHGAARGASAEREREQATAVRRAGHGAAPCFAPSPVRSRHTQVRYGTGWNTGARGSWDGASWVGKTRARRSTGTALFSCCLPLCSSLSPTRGLSGPVDGRLLCSFKPPGRPARRLSSWRHLSLSPSSSARLDSFRPSAVVKLTRRR